MSSDERHSLPQIRTNMEEAKQDLAAVGIARFSGAFTCEELAEALHRLQEQAVAEDELGIAYRDNGHVGHDNQGPNQRVWNLLNKGEIFGRLVTNPAMLELARHLLGEKILLSSLTANIACKGAAVQRLHSDQWWAPEIQHALMVNCFIMLSEFTPENGATRVVPGSHLSGKANPSPSTQSVPATGPAGTILAFDARMWHGTGANQTANLRYGLLPRYCKPYIRQQENMPLSLAPEVLARLSVELKGLCGFMVWQSFGMIGDDVKTQVHDGRLTRFVTELKSAAHSSV